MKALEEFVANFTDKKINNVVKIKNSFFICGSDLLEIKNKIKEEPVSAGLFLGELKNGKFIPSANLLDIVSELSDKKIFVNKKTEWLFLCKRDVFGKGIAKANAEKGLVLVQNELDENVGYGEIVDDLSKKDKVVVKNLFDKGSFLRRERK